jgi:signal peptidase II
MSESETQPTPELPAEPTSQPTEPEEPKVEPLFAPTVARLEMPTGAGRAIPAEGSPSYLFLAIVSVLTLGIDLGSKQWAEKTLDLRPPMIVFEKYVDFILARNKGGAWGLLQTTSELVRRPFFLLVSALAIGFIVTLYSRLQPRQRALKWGLPLVLGGALGNVFDRIHYGWVIDFIDVHITQKGIEHHWPTFNVADIAICLGVALMAIDMMLGKRAPKTPPPAETHLEAAEVAAPVTPADESAAVVGSHEAADAPPVPADK